MAAVAVLLFFSKLYFDLLPAPLLSSSPGFVKFQWSGEAHLYFLCVYLNLKSFPLWGSWRGTHVSLVVFTHVC